MNKNGQKRVNLIQVIIVSTTVGKNPLEEMEQLSQSTEEFEMQFLGAVSNLTGWSRVISKANHSTSTSNGRKWRVVQVFAPNTDAEEAEVDRFYEDLQDLVELTPKKQMSFSS